VRYRITLIGSTFVARRTGPSSAIDAHASSINIVAASVNGSKGFTP
jgi:hypothetical protein